MNRFIWVDAFTETPYGGNPCAVVFDADSIAVDDRIAFTRETGLVECAFLVGSTKASFGARYYMPTGEIPMAGHPTIATVTAMLDAGVIAPDIGSFTLEVGAGVIGVDVTPREGAPALITMTQLAPTFGRIYEPAQIAGLYGLRPKDVIGAPQTVSTGSPFCITHLHSLEALRAARLDYAALAAMQKDGVDFMEPYLCVTDGVGGGDTFARLLLPPPFPPEDPFTGSATGCMAAYLFAKGVVGRRFRAAQGHDLGRPGVAEVEVLGEADAITGVRVGGSGVVIMRGEALIPTGGST